MSNTTVDRRRALAMAGAAGLGVLGVAGAASAQKAAKLEKLETALTAMREAKTFMEKGAGFGGHKKKAVDALATAITELEAAIKFAQDKKG